MNFKEYDRKSAREYAKKWAYSRNPRYYNFDNVGGDCTSFVSQCIYAGSRVMNYNKNTGWYYKSASDRAPAWSSVELLHKFLINNKGVGPNAIECRLKELQIGDIVQLSFDGNTFGHTLLVVDVGDIKDLNNIFIASHTYDSYNRRVSSYSFQDIRFIHIDKITTW